MIVNNQLNAMDASEVVANDPLNEVSGKWDENPLNFIKFEFGEMLLVAFGAERWYQKLWSSSTTWIDINEYCWTDGHWRRIESS